MPMEVQINTGFITNSSSAVCWFDSDLLSDPEVKSFLSAMECSEGYVGEDLWDRSECGSFLVTSEQKSRAGQDLRSPDWLEPEEVAGNTPEVQGAEIVVIYGDEYESLSRVIADILSSAHMRLHGEDSIIRKQEFN